MSITLSLSGNSSVLTANYFPPIELNREYECALVDFHTYNSIPNVDYDNNLFHIGDNIIEIPIGSYELEDIVDYITQVYKKQNVNKNVEIKANNNTLQIEIFSKQDKILFNEERSIGQLFGFEKQILEPNIVNKSNLPVNILRVNVIQIQSNITTGAYVNNSTAHTLHEFGVRVSPGYKIQEIPSNLIYMKINVKEISCLKVWIVDQDGRLVNFRGEEISLRLHLRPTSS